MKNPIVRLSKTKPIKAVGEKIAGGVMNVLDFAKSGKRAREDASVKAMRFYNDVNTDRKGQPAPFKPLSPEWKEYTVGKGEITDRKREQKRAMERKLKGK